MLSDISCYTSPKLRVTSAPVRLFLDTLGAGASLSGWARRQVGFHFSLPELDQVCGNFGEALALHFAFLSFYNRSIFVSLYLVLLLNAWGLLIIRSTLSTSRFGRSQLLTFDAFKSALLSFTMAPLVLLRFCAVVSNSAVPPTKTTTAPPPPQWIMTYSLTDLGSFSWHSVRWDILVRGIGSGVKPLSAPDVEVKINLGLLHALMLAYAVANQAISIILEMGSPFAVCGVTKARANQSLAGKRSGEGKAGSMTEPIEHVRGEVCTLEHGLFGDYSEMVIQGGRPIPPHVDIVGSWLEALGYTARVGVLTNAAIVYLSRCINNIHTYSTTAA
ncbi:hypothetical protein BDV93DRAFT_512652 [Ceratobasidium sp. AG-I]|nr:hypothetical protein BDV93DRAFT_512652 [Ceratobasidium sp. AG-I]